MRSFAGVVAQGAAHSIDDDVETCSITPSASSVKVEGSFLRRYGPRIGHRILNLGIPWVVIFEN